MSDTTDFKALLSCQRQNLIDNIVYNGSLIYYLRIKGVLTEAQEKTIRDAHPHQVETLLNILPKGRDNTLGMFCEALVTCGQASVVDKFLKPPEGAAYLPSSLDEPDGASRYGVGEEITSTAGNRNGYKMKTSSQKTPKKAISTKALPAIKARTPAKSLKGKETTAQENKHTLQDDSMQSQDKTTQYFARAKTQKLSQMEKTISSEIPLIICDVKRDSLEFMELFKKLGKKENLVFLGVKDGMTMMHQVVNHKRTSFLEVIFNLGIWDMLVDIRMDETLPSYERLTPIEMAQKMNLSMMWKEIDRLNRQEESLEVFHKAARAGNVLQVEHIINQNPSAYAINKPSMFGRTPLYWAATAGNKIIMEKLVQAGADSHFKTENGDTIMTRVVGRNHVHLVRPLVSEWGLDPEERGADGKTPMLIAAENGSVEMCKSLLNVGATLTSSSLISAASKGRSVFIVYLLEEHHMDPNSMDCTGKTALLAAAAGNQLTTVEILLDRGADIAMADKRKRNILHFAIEGKSDMTLKTVIRLCKEKDGLHFSDLLNAQDIFLGTESIFLVKGKDSGRQAWHYVLVERALMHLFHEKTQGGPIDVAKFGSVVQSGWGPRPNQTICKEIDLKYSAVQIPATAPPDMTPLMLAIMKEQHDSVQILLQEKPKLDKQDYYGLSALHLACMKGSLKTAKALLQTRSSSDVKDKQGRTPIMVARENGHTAIVNLLDGHKHHIMIKTFVNGNLSRAFRSLDSRSLEEQHNSSRDVGHYAVSVLRDLQADINQLLYDMGSAPVGQETSN